MGGWGGGKKGVGNTFVDNILEKVFHKRCFTSKYTIRTKF